MALTASTLITTAKQRVFGVVGTQKVPNATLLAELSYQDMIIVQMLSQIAPDLLASVGGVITFTDAGNIAGYALNAGMHYRDFTHVDSSTDRPVPINMLQRQHRDSRPAAPAGMLRTNSAGAVFYPIDPANKRWQGGSSSNFFEPDKSHTGTYSYISIPAAVTSLSATLASPDMAREIFVTALEVRILLINPQEGEGWKLRVQSAIVALQEAKTSLTFQAYRFMQPQGQPGGGGQSDSNWVHDQVTS